jgi:hypothetical protein
MFYTFLALLVSLSLDVLTVRRKTQGEQDLEILVLRHQLRLLQRKVEHAPRLSRFEKLILAVLAARFKASVHGLRQRLEQSLLLVKPEAMLKWHRELVARKWAFRRTGKVGRPRTSAEVEALVVRLAKENAGWGADQIHGELLTLGFALGATTVRDILARYGIPPAPERQRKGSSWRQLMQHYAHQPLACDFFTVETAWLKTLYVLFFIEVGSRRVHIMGCIAHPNSLCVTQQARQLVWTLPEAKPTWRFLVHDRDAKFTAAFDAVFAAESMDILLTPPHAPNANAVAERWVRSVRQEYLDHLLILNQAHLRRVLTDYVTYYNLERPHQGIAHQTPVPSRPPPAQGPVQRRDRLGGILHTYFREAA